MAECSISCITDKVNANEENVNNIPEGKVGKVCKEWLVREDGVLAYRLQNEEISQHYEGNRHKNRTVREDLPIAKVLQRSEEEVATEVALSYERILNQQLEADERVARDIERRLREQEYSRRLAEEEDEKMAKRMAQKEKARLARKRLEREKQQVEKLSAQFGSGSTSGALNGVNEPIVGAVAQSLESMHLRDSNASPDSADDELDLSEFCLQPPADLSPEELRAFLEEQDAEIARLLQLQEQKRKSTVDKEKLAQIEAQDYEIARLLQKQEKERVRRLKEKAKQRALQKQLEDNQSIHSNTTNGLLHNNRNDRNSDNISDNSIDRQSNSIYGEREPPKRRQQPLPHPPAPNYYSDTDSITYEEITHQLYHPNIATYLDPTYNRNSTVLSNPLLNSSPNSLRNCPQSQDIESNVDDNILLEEPGIHFAQVYKVTPTPSPSDSPYSTTQRPTTRREPLRDPMPIEDNYYPIDESVGRNRDISPTSPVPPYLPVQGQRRLSSMEKKKKSKDSCKTQ